MDQMRQMALIEAMHLADIKGSHLKKESTADEVINNAKIFHEFLSDAAHLRSV